MKSKTQILDKLLTPSWLSGLIAVAGGLIVTFGVIIAFNVNSSQAHQQLIGWEDTSTPALALPGQDLGDASGNNSLQSTWPLLGFWAVVGLIVYFAAESAMRSLQNAEELREELSYVHVRRDLLIKVTLESLLLRLVAAVVLVFSVEAFFKRIIPYSITAAQAASSDPISPGAVLYTLLSFCMVVLSLHLLTVFLRLTAGRARLFSVR